MSLRTVLPATLDAALDPQLSRVAVHCRIGRVHVPLVLIVAPSGCVVGAVWVLAGRVFDAPIGLA